MMFGIAAVLVLLSLLLPNCILWLVDFLSTNAWSLLPDLNFVVASMIYILYPETLWIGEPPSLHIIGQERKKLSICLTI